MTMSLGRRREDPSRAPPDIERCEALLRDFYGRPTEERCWCFASVHLDGRRMCGKHAGLHALQLMLKAGTAVELPRAPQVRGVVRFVEE